MIVLMFMYSTLNLNIFACNLFLQLMLMRGYMQTAILQLFFLNGEFNHAKSKREQGCQLLSSGKCPGLQYALQYLVSDVQHPMKQ